MDVEYSNDDVLGITGPAGWTEVVYAELSKQVGSTITWKNLTGMKEPRLYGDILVLPINGFASNVPHSGAQDRGKGMMILAINSCAKSMH